MKRILGEVVGREPPKNAGKILKAADTVLDKFQAEEGEEKVKEATLTTLKDKLVDAAAIKGSYMTEEMDDDTCMEGLVVWKNLNLAKLQLDAILDVVSLLPLLQKMTSDEDDKMTKY